MILLKGLTMCSFSFFDTSTRIPPTSPGTSPKMLLALSRRSVQIRLHSERAPVPKLVIMRAFSLWKPCMSVSSLERKVLPSERMPSNALCQFASIVDCADCSREIRSERYVLVASSSAERWSAHSWASAPCWADSAPSSATRWADSAPVSV